MIKKKVLITLLIIVSTLSINHVYAVDTAIKTVSFDSGGSPGSSGPHVRPHMNLTYNGQKYICYYEKNLSTERNITVNAYDVNGNSLIPYKTEIQDSNIKLLSGTWVGISVAEKKYAAWSFTSEIVQEKYKYRCRYSERNIRYCSQSFRIIGATSCPTSCSQNNCNTITKPSGQTVSSCTCYTNSEGSPTLSYEDIISYKSPSEISLNDCPAKYGKQKESITHTGTETIPVNNDYLKQQCQNAQLPSTVMQAIGYVIGGGSVEVTYKATNDINDDITKIATGRTYSDYTPPSGYPVSGMVTATYYPSPEKVCINVLTGNALYDSDCQNSEEYMIIPNGKIYENSLRKYVEYWHYFIPLNTKTQNAQSSIPFSIRLEDRNLETLKPEQCNYVMLNYPDDYKYRIAPKSGGEFEGKYDHDIGNVRRNNGCKFSTAIIFDNNIIQKFYNEIEQSTTEYLSLKGYGMYFRQIDINNPFPNGLGSSTYWSDIYNDRNNSVTVNEKTTKLSASYNKLTYVARNVSTSKIAAYNRDNPYNSWLDMTISGKSKFISNEGIVTRRSYDSFYKLGCGPMLEDKDWSGCSK